MKTFLAVLFAVTASAAFAGEAPFSRVYTVETASKGQVEFEQIVRHRTGRSTGRYSAFDFASEVEYGFTDRLQGAFYLKYGRLDMSGVPDDAGDPSSRHQFALHGVSAELIATVLHPDSDDFGLGFYYEPEFSVHELGDGTPMREFGNEYRLMLQKDFLTDRLMLVYNLILEPEFKKSPGDTSWKGALVFANEAGVSFKFVDHWSAGWELRNVNELEDFDRHEKSVYQMGPALNYNAGRAWFTLGVLGKVRAYPREAGEKWETTLKFGYPF